MLCQTIILYIILLLTYLCYNPLQGVFKEVVVTKFRYILYRNLPGIAVDRHQNPITVVGVRRSVCRGAWAQVHSRTCINAYVRVHTYEHTYMKAYLHIHIHVHMVILPYALMCWFRPCRQLGVSINEFTSRVPPSSTLTPPTSFTSSPPPVQPF